MTEDEKTRDIDSRSIARVVSDASETKAYLVFIAGPSIGKTLQIDESELVVGRSKNADVTVQDSAVSRQHARFHLREEGVYVEDLDSHNGTFVNGTAIEQFRYLRDGDKVTLGSNTILKFTFQDRLDEQFQNRLIEAATRDSLTGAYNRRHLDEQMAAELAYAWRHDGRLSLLLFDVDDFKEINDTRGHLAGDAVLEQLARAVRHAIRLEDFFARYGGDEFAILSRGLNQEQAMDMAERLRQAVDSDRFVFEGEAFHVTISIGVASVPDLRIEDGAKLIEAADTALYSSKGHGKNRAEYCRKTPSG